MPGNAALCEPIDLQSERPSMNVQAWTSSMNLFVNILDIDTLKVLKDFTSYYTYTWL